MAHHIPKAPGYLNMLKDGARYFQGKEETTNYNIDACKKLSATTSSSFGPLGMKKLVINHIERKFVTKDAATIIKELEVAHPAAKLMVLATGQQEEECGGGTNFVMLLCGALLTRAEELLRIGLSIVDVVDGYEKSLVYVLNTLKELVVDKVNDTRCVEDVSRVIRSTIMGKMFDYEKLLGRLITEACVSTISEETNSFNPDYVRIVKIPGAGLDCSEVIKGMVFVREARGNVKMAKDASVAVYSCPFDIIQPETTGTILINTAEELVNFSREEENDIEKLVKSVADLGVKVVISGSSVGDLAIHYANKYGLMIVKILSKYDLRRFCAATGATILPKFVCPLKSDLGHVSTARIDEIGGRQVVIFEQDKKEGQVATIIVRGSMEGLLDEAERAIQDGVNSFKSICKDNRLLPGAGACEIELACRLQEYANTQPGLIQYVVRAFGKSFEAVVKALAENAGQKASDIVAELYSLHHKGEQNSGVVFDGNDSCIKDATHASVFDGYKNKYWGIKYAGDCAISILKVDQIIMAKPAGGVPTPKQPGAPQY